MTPLRRSSLRNTFCRTLAIVTQPISVRLDDEAFRALRRLEASGMTRSEAVRQALIESAERAQRREALRREVMELEADEADRKEIRELAALMEQLRAPW